MRIDGLATSVHRAARPFAVAVLLPGFLDSRLGPGTASLAQALAAAGVTALTVDPRGSGESDGTPEHLAPRHQLAELGLLLDEIGRVETVERVVLAGHCYGGLLAMLGAARDPRVTDVVALMPTRYFIWPEDYDERRDTWRQAGARAFVREDVDRGTRREYRVPYSVVADARSHDWPAAVAGLRQRILFVAGELDAGVPTASVRELYRRCGSRCKHLAVLPGVQHDYRDHPDQIEAVSSAVLHWLDGVPAVGEMNSRATDDPAPMDAARMQA